MECMKWDNSTLIKVANELLEEDVEKTKKHRQERKFALKDDSSLFFRTFIESKYGYNRNRKNSYFSEYYPNGLDFVKTQNLEHLIFDLVHGLIKPEEIKLEYQKEKERLENCYSDTEIFNPVDEMMDTLGFYSVMGVLSNRVKEQEIDDTKLPKNLKEYIEDIISYDEHMEEKMKKQFGAEMPEKKDELKEIKIRRTP